MKCPNGRLAIKVRNEIFSNVLKVATLFRRLEQKCDHFDQPNTNHYFLTMVCHTTKKRGKTFGFMYSTTTAGTT